MTDKIKRGLAYLAVSVAAIAATALVPHGTLAAGEQYQWTSTDHQSINVTGGRDTSGNNVTASGTLQQTGGSGNSARTYSGNVTFNCSTGAQTGNVSLTIGGSNYIDGKPITPTSGQISNRNVACVNLDSSIGIAQASGQNNTSAQAAIDNPAATPASELECDQGSVSWMMCPFITNASGAISKVGTSIIAPFLRVEPLNRYDENGNETDLYKAWNGFKNLAYALFIIVFVVIIYATLTQQDIGFLDSYTIKKILPRLVVAALLVQASFLISGFFIDIGNVGGVGISQLLNSITNPSDPANIANIITNLLGVSAAMVVGFGFILGTASWLALGPLLLSMLLSVLVVVLVLGLRYLLIAVLVVLSPLAMLAWVLPNTRKWFGNWLELFLRLVLMYPVIIGIIALAGISNSILPSTTDVADNDFAGVVTSIIRPIIVIAAFAVIPFTFKLAGAGINRAYSIFNGQAQRGKGMLKRSDYWERGKKERQKRSNKVMGNLMNSSAMTSLSSKGRTGRATAGLVSLAAAGALIGAPTSRRTLQSSNNKLVNDDKKRLSDLAEAGNPGNLKGVLAAYAQEDPKKRKEAIAKLKAQNPELAQIGSNHTGRRAIANKLADMGALGGGDINNLLDAAKRDNIFSVSRDVAAEYPDLINEVGKESSAKPFVVRRVTNSNKEYQLKDALGNDVIKTLPDGTTRKVTIEREVGDLDLNSAATALRTVSAHDLGDKFGTDNWDVIIKGSDRPVGTREFRVAQDATRLTAENLEIDSISGAFNTDSRNAAPLKNRLFMSTALQKQRDVFVETTQGKRKYEALIHDLHRDEDLSREIAKLAGVSDSKLESASTAELGRIARDWMRTGESYDPFHDYTVNEKSAALIDNYDPPTYRSS